MIEIYNSLGTCVFRNQINSVNLLLDISGYSSGIYFIKIKNGNIEKSEKLIIE